MTSTTPVSPPVKGPAKTSYVILLNRPGDSDSLTTWRLETTVEATSADVAVRQWAENNALDGVILVAIPKRSWQPRKIRVETSTKVTLG